MSVAALSRDFATEGARAVADMDLLAILESPAVQRLASIEFMGILARGDASPQSRLEHSLGAVHLGTCAGRSARLPDAILRHIVAALLIHDASTWPLSHTGEEAFRRITGLSNGILKHAIVFDEPSIPSKYHLGLKLAEANLDQTLLWSLLAKNAAGRDPLASAGVDLLKCAANPDTLDGIARTAANYSMDCPSVARIAQAFRYQQQTLCFETSSLPILDEFWLTKAKVYVDHIYAPEAVQLEHTTAEALYSAFHGIPVGEALDLTDADVLEKIEGYQPTGVFADMELRFRPHQTYAIDRSVVFSTGAVPARDLAKRYVRQDLD